MTNFKTFIACAIMFLAFLAPFIVCAVMFSASLAHAEIIVEQSIDDCVQYYYVVVSTNVETVCVPVKYKQSKIQGYFEELPDDATDYDFTGVKYMNVKRVVTNVAYTILYPTTESIGKLVQPPECLLDNEK